MAQKKTSMTVMDAAPRLKRSWTPDKPSPSLAPRQQDLGLQQMSQEWTKLPRDKFLQELAKRKRDRTQAYLEEDFERGDRLLPTIEQMESHARTRGWLAGQ
jgi:hypothetical protein